MHNRRTMNMANRNQADCGSVEWQTDDRDMKISPHIRDFFRFTVFVVLACAGLLVLWKCRLNPHTLGPLLCGLFIVFSLSFVGVLGMVWSLVEWQIEWLASLVVRWRRAKAARRGVANHKIL